LDALASPTRKSDQDAVIVLADVKLTLPSQAGPVHILNGVSLTIERGEAVGLVGPSGSGKSTLLMILAGLEKASSGRVQVAGFDFAGLGEDALAGIRKRHIGIVFQSFHLIPTMTALENVAVPLELSGAADAFARARRELEAVGLAHRLDHYPSQLSGGEQQRVALARAMAPRPSIVLADEPTGNLDGKTGEAIVDLLFQLHAERQATLILITHDETLAHRCERVVRLRDGMIDRIEAGASRSAPKRHAGTGL
jgi:putative ABC transport system ATP-binding protein